MHRFLSVKLGFYHYTFCCNTKCAIYIFKYLNHSISLHWYFLHLFIKIFTFGCKVDVRQVLTQRQALWIFVLCSLGQHIEECSLVVCSFSQVQLLRNQSEIFSKNLSFFAVWRSPFYHPVYYSTFWWSKVIYKCKRC